MTTVVEALRHQRDACAALGSPLMARLLDAVVGDVERGGPCRQLLEGRTDRPIHDALPLRLMGAVHRLVLDGEAPELARFYPSVGGADDGDPSGALLDAITSHLAEVEAGLERTVQTNEVGRAAVLAGGFAEIARRAQLPLRELEVGASGGLLLRWDRYGYDTGLAQLGDRRSPLQFGPSWWKVPAPVDVEIDVVERRGCDIAPIDATTVEGQRTLLSFVWPDQRERIERLRAAFEVAVHAPVAIDEADAGDWVAEQLARPLNGAATVVHHSIVLQYLPRPSLERLRTALRDAGSRATSDAPLAWLRMEPAGPVADLRLTMWPDGTELVLGTSGYHGHDIVWSPAPAR